MYNLDTKKEVDMDLFFEALENGEIIIDGRNMTEEDLEEIRKAVAEHRASRQKNKIAEPTLV